MHAHKYLININCLFVLNIAFPLVVMTIEEGICMGGKKKWKGKDFKDAEVEIRY